MLSDTLRQRLEQLNRQAMPARSGQVAVRAEAEIEPEAAAESARDALPRIVQRSIPGVSLEPKQFVKPPAQCAKLPGEVTSTHCGDHWLVRQPVSAVWPAVESHFNQWQLARASAEQISLPQRMPKRTRRYLTEASSLAEAFPRDTLFLDLETCGLAGSMLFLVGLIRFDGEALVLEQLLARNYAEEQAVLHTLWQIAASSSLLVTFNGKSFDWPLVQDRSTYHRIGRQVDVDTEAEAEVVQPNCASPLGPADPRPVLAHVDLLHHARRRWRERLPDCRLQTLERFLCHRHRSGDIPGREIPDAYHRYVSTGRIDQMQAILHHNALDLVTLVQLAMLMTRGENAGEPTARIATEEAA